MNDVLKLTSARALRDLMARHGFQLKKQYGQNFLVDERVLDAIAAASGLTHSDGALEIGPGAGVVTRRLAERAKSVVAIEKDRSLAPVLAESLKGCNNVEIVYDDVLEVDLARIWKHFAEAGCEHVAVVANLPYYITTPILFHLFDAGVDWARMVVMVQREVAQRMAAPPGGKTYGALSVAVQYRADVQTVARVSPGSFLPPPDVESAVLCLERRLTTPVAVTDEAAFFRVVRAAFATRRKTLANALSTGLGIPKESALTLLARTGVDGGRRGETLTLAEFANIANTLVQPS
ncbi:16S rRNA (adenine(1518)-N(6)/adenine(1519)-N(6))-dimethyltransferase RsmA [Alicyclobacillus sp. ALC3]|uniref:16S rRNA (adenine(1518)-N(6)/adenine(1519)-N(6))- dimethyltransferase RsmA n=1 Tax=Alicyclobacillus sp. ALC3 TaxID=2796143 RepID=UPI002378299D|nr:16S rRNA (adenine(1518)-N(6)/adenine(1519)-N(6))-dimethyltransferase RsmA [Alicyclobacillus sp. ALC3]WDL99006.1 16S rRNA (adenine(1518)-N(6)/adenine(1519)-N(6))-dimethyltransferase RsmA [Alicyclobacillus sp. ALC3]